jgi:hypothetical protein
MNVVYWYSPSIVDDFIQSAKPGDKLVNIPAKQCGKILKRLFDSGRDFSVDADQITLYS